MGRFLKVLALRCLFSAAGLVAVVLGAWALTFFRSEGLVTASLVLGLAGVLPVSLAVADNVLPRRPLPRGTGLSPFCPHCGVAFAPAPGRLALRLNGGPRVAAV